MNATKVERQGEVHGAIEATGTEIIRTVTRSEDPLRDELLWGIPNEVALNHIAIMLPRGAYEAVARVNSDWQRAFEGRMVYDARIRSQTMQTFLVVWCTVATTVDYVKNRGADFGDTTKIYKNTVSLFSPSEERWYKLPPIPGSHEGTRYDIEHVLLDGSIYVLGGARDWNDAQSPSAEVFVVDLAGQPLEWRRCANMQAPRCNPKVGLMQGKIYVFGGRACHYHPECRNEVYDPKADAWSFITPTMPSASTLNVFSVGQQFLACIGWKKRPQTPKPEKPVNDGEADIYRDTKFVVRVDDRGPKLVSTTRDDDAEDDVDSLHWIITIQLLGLGRGLDKPVGRHRHWSSAEHFASRIRYHERSDARAGKSESFFGFYDPAKDEWRVFEKESLGTDIDVDAVLGPKHLGSLYLMPRLDSDGPRQDDWAMACVSSVNL